MDERLYLTKKQKPQSLREKDAPLASSGLAEHNVDTLFSITESSLRLSSLYSTLSIADLQKLMTPE